MALPREIGAVDSPPNKFSTARKQSVESEDIRVEPYPETSTLAFACVGHLGAVAMRSDSEPDSDGALSF